METVQKFNCSAMDYGESHKEVWLNKVISQAVQALHQHYLRNQ